MDMLWRALYAMGMILKLLLEMMITIAVDSISDAERMGEYMKRVMEIASSELEVNPVFAAMFMAVMFFVGWFVVNQIKGSLQTAIITVLIAAAIFIIVFMTGI